MRSQRKIRHEYSVSALADLSLDVRSRILITLLFIISIVTTAPYQLLMFLIYAGLISWGAALARISLVTVFGRALIVLPFSLVVALGVPFFTGGETVVFFGLELSIAGLWTLAGVVMKSFLSASTLVLLITVTPINLLMQGLRGLGVPVLLIDLLNLTYRYLFVMLEEAMTLRQAAIARGYRPKWLPQAVIVGRLAGTLFLRSFYRAENIYAAMRLRGYKQVMPSDALPKYEWTSIMMVVLFVFMLISIRLYLGCLK
ncbi:MAG: cobalt ECF transporter T component CbiQ [Gammaproteobacteria bacterium]|nr:cobalt ECF transporter T component CbiQ [Gammaproteobacteria bacterium]